MNGREEEMRHKWVSERANEENRKERKKDKQSVEMIWKVLKNIESVKLKRR